MWIELIASWTQSAAFHPPASEADIQACEQALGHRLPEDLASLLRERNGVDGEHDLGLIWPAGRIAQDNALSRTRPDFAELYMPFDPLLFFGDLRQLMRKDLGLSGSQHARPHCGQLRVTMRQQPACGNRSRPGVLPDAGHPTATTNEMHFLHQPDYLQDRPLGRA